MQLASLETVRSLAARLARTAGRRASKEVVGTGCPALDRWLPGQGLVRGALVEWLGVGQGSGASSLALALGWQACQAGKVLAVVDGRRLFYPPAVLAWGIPAGRLVVVRPASERDLAWSMDQILRSPSIGAVVAWPEKIGDHTFRRWQLAAEAGNTLGMLVRSAQGRAGPSWADLRWRVTPLLWAARPGAALPEPPALARRILRLELLRHRSSSIELLAGDQPAGNPVASGSSAQHIDLEFEPCTGRLHETHSLSVASPERRGA